MLPSTTLIILKPTQISPGHLPSPPPSNLRRQCSPPVAVLCHISTSDPAAHLLIHRSCVVRQIWLPWPIPAASSCHLVRSFDTLGRPSYAGLSLMHISLSPARDERVRIFPTPASSFLRERATKTPKREKGASASPLPWIRTQATNPPFRTLEILKQTPLNP